MIYVCKQTTNNQVVDQLTLVSHKAPYWDQWTLIYVSDHQQRSVPNILMIPPSVIILKYKICPLAKWE